MVDVYSTHFTVSKRKENLHYKHCSIGSSYDPRDADWNLWKWNCVFLVLLVVSLNNSIYTLH